MKKKMTQAERDKRRQISKRWLRENNKKLFPVALLFAIALLFGYLMPQKLPGFWAAMVTGIPAFAGLYIYYRFVGLWEKSVDREYKRYKASREKRGK